VLPMDENRAMCLTLIDSIYSTNSPPRTLGSLNEIIKLAQEQW